MTNKRFLILAPYFFPYQNPRARRVLKLLEQIDKKGFKADVVCSSRSLNPNYLSENIEIYPCGFNSIKEKFSSLSGIPSPKNDSSSIGSKIKSVAKDLNGVFLKSFYWPDDSFVWIKKAKATCFKLIESQSYDAIICFSLPYVSLMVGEQVKAAFPNILWINDIGDPLAFQSKNLINNTWLYENRNQKAEQRILNKANLNIVTNEGLKRIYQQKFKIQEDQLKVVGPFNQVGFPINEQAADKAFSFLYLGTFYTKLRSPKRLILMFKDILKQFPDRNPQLWIAGPIKAEEAKLFQSDPSLKDHVTIYPFLNKEDTQDLIQKSRFLVNISNLSKHQLPSKCADYIASCLPIINVFELENDVSSAYLKRHPMVFNYNSSLVNANQTVKLKGFIDEHNNKLIQQDLSKDLLSNSSPEYLLQCIMNLWKR